MSTYHPAARLVDCPAGTAREVVVAGHIVALFNVDGTIYAMDGVCPHQGGPLGEGRLDGDRVTCPWHGWQFCVRTGQHQTSASLRHPCWSVRVEDDTIFVAFDPPGSK